MPAFLLGLAPLLRRHWKPLAGAAALALVFLSGWKVNGWRYESRIESERADRAQAIAEAVQAREAELLEDLRRQQEAAQGVARRLSEILAQARMENAGLVAEIDSAALVKPAAPTCDGDIPHANPFSAEFVRLWNRPSLRLSLRLSDD